MSFKAELIIDGKTFPVKRFLLSMERKTNDKGRPSSMPAWRMVVRIESISDTTLTSWMIDPSKSLDGKVRLYKINQDSKYKEISFTKSSCYHMVDSFRSYTSYATCEVGITGGELQILDMVIVKA